EKINQLKIAQEIANDLLQQAETIAKTDLNAKSIDVKNAIKKCLLLKLKINWNINTINGYVEGNDRILQNVIINNELSNQGLHEFFTELNIYPDSGCFVDRCGNPTILSQFFTAARKWEIKDFFSKTPWEKFTYHGDKLGLHTAQSLLY